MTKRIQLPQPLLGLAATLLCLEIWAATPARADLREDCRDGDDRVAACTKLIQRNPRDHDAYYNRGLEYYSPSERKFDLALKDFNKAIESAPRTPKYLLSRAGLYMGGNSSPLEDYALALADSTKAVELDPSSAEAYASRCKAYYYLADREHALADCAKAQSLDSRNTNAKMWSGMVGLIPAAAQAPGGTPVPISCSFANGAVRLVNAPGAELAAKIVIKWTLEYAKPLSSPSKSGYYLTAGATPAGSQIGLIMLSSSAPIKSCSATAKLP
jgi:tetratricopeptide (TPR) repeat protein